MPQLSTTKSLRADELPRDSAFNIATLALIAQRLSSQHHERDVIELLSAQAHESFFPAPAAVLIRQENGLEAAGLTSPDERLDWILRSDPSGLETVSSAVSETLQNGKAGLY